MKENICIQNDSGDKDFFTIIPNYIIDNTDAIQRALYIEMKRYAGENGSCFATQETMQNRLGIGKKAFVKALDFLLAEGWVSYMGFTRRKTRPVKTYKINNIWAKNSTHYKKIPLKRAVSLKDTSQKSSKIPLKRAVEEEPYINNTSETSVSQSKYPEAEGYREFALQEDTEVAKATSVTRKFNPTPVYKLFNNNYPLNWRVNKTQRQSAENLFKERGLEKIRRALAFYQENKDDEFCPDILSPYDLDSKWDKLLKYKLKKYGN